MDVIRPRYHRECLITCMTDLLGRLRQGRGARPSESAVGGGEDHIITKEREDNLGWQQCGLSIRLIS
jgi:hypothetical protein